MMDQMGTKATDHDGILAGIWPHDVGVEQSIWLACHVALGLLMLNAGLTAAGGPLAMMTS